MPNLLGKYGRSKTRLIGAVGLLAMAIAGIAPATTAIPASASVAPQ